MRDQTPLRFGPFELDSGTLELRRDGRLIPLEPRPALLLRRLAETPGRMVPRRELRELGWPRLPDAAEQSLNTCVYQIRRALDGSGRHGVTIDTLRGRGYRMSVPRATEVGAASSRSNGWRWAAGLVLLAGATLGTAHLAEIRSGRGSAPPPEVVRVVDRARYLAEHTRDPAAALSVVDSALARFPSAALLHGLRAELGLQTGDVEGARTAAARALRLDPAAIPALRTGAMIALLDGDPRAADRKLDRAIAADGDDPVTLVALAYRWIVGGDVPVALSHLERALALDPISVSVQRDAGLLYLLAGRYREAEQHCSEAARLEPEAAWAIDCLFDLHVLQGRTKQAAHWGRRLVQVQGASQMAESDPQATVEAVERWRLEAWERAVRRGAYPLGLAFAYAANDRPKDALTVLRDAAAAPRPGLLSVGVDPRLSALRAVPGFRELLLEMGLYTVGEAVSPG